MKTIKYLWTLCLALAAFTLTACSDDDNGGSSAAMQINQIYLENVDDEVNQDRPVEFARLGQLLRIEGSGFSGLKKIYVNGYETYFNNALMTDNNVWVTLNAATPIDKADADVRNTIVFYKNENNKLVYEFTIRAAAPAVTSVDNTLPKAGETVTVYGANLQETTKVTLPDGTEITDGIRNDADGKWYSFTVPSSADLTKSGSITSEGANGTAKSPTYFNDFGNFITDFDGNGELGSWSATYGTDDLVDDPLNTGRGKVALLAPQSLLDAGGLDAGGNGKYWATAGNDNANDDWSRMYTTIPAETSASDLAIQFDIYCPEPWDLTGQLEISAEQPERLWLGISSYKVQRRVHQHSYRMGSLAEHRGWFSYSLEHRRTLADHHHSDDCFWQLRPGEGSRRNLPEDCRRQKRRFIQELRPVPRQQRPGIL